MMTKGSAPQSLSAPVAMGRSYYLQHPALLFYLRPRLSDRLLPDNLHELLVNQLRRLRVGHCPKAKERFLDRPRLPGLHPNQLAVETLYAGTGVMGLLCETLCLSASAA
eukprot:14956-Eustigmatos_ZCMA.PRE.1